MGNIQGRVNFLTEEELKDIENFKNYRANVSWEVVALIIQSCRNLLSANAELKDENFDLKASVILNVRENKRLRAELEEIK